MSLSENAKRLFKMKCWAVVFCVCCTVQLFSQKNLLCAEMGMHQRGLIGISYNRIVVHQERWLLTTGIGYGIGGTPFGKQVNHFAYGTVNLGIGMKGILSNNYLTIGADIKYLNYGLGDYDESLSAYVARRYEGVGVMPFIGLTLFAMNNWFLQMRAAPLFLMHRFTIADKTPGVGVSFGKVF